MSPDREAGRDAGAMLDAAQRELPVREPPEERDAAAPRMSTQKPAPDAGQLEKLRVLKAAPADGEVLTDLTGHLTLELSAEIDDNSVTPETFHLSRDGIDQACTPAIDGAQLKLAPQNGWVLSSPYTVELTSGVRSTDGRALAPQRWTFQVRKGQWSKKQLSAVDAKRDLLPTLSVTRQGDAAVVWATTDESYQSYSYVIHRHVSGDAWRAAPPVDGSVLVGGAALNTIGDVAVASDKGVVVWDATDEQRFVSPVSSDDVHQLQFTGERALQILHQSGTMLVRTLARAGEDDVVKQSYSSDVTQHFQTSMAPVGAAFLAVWKQTGSSGASDEVWGSGRGDCVLFDGGCPAPFSEPGRTADGPTIASDPNARSLIASWVEQAGSWSTVRAKRIDGGSTWGMPVPISEPTGTAGWPQVGLDGKERALVVWSQGTENARPVLWALFDPATNAWSAPRNLSGNSMHFAQRVALAVSASGYAIAVWMQSAANSGSASEPAPVDVRAALYSPDTGWALEPMPLSKNAIVTRSHLSLGMSDNGHAFVAWQEDGENWVGRYE
jgi:hypothetical protein